VVWRRQPVFRQWDAARVHLRPEAVLDFFRDGRLRARYYCEILKPFNPIYPKLGMIFRKFHAINKLWPFRW
jgi:hypothetical protein